MRILSLLVALLVVGVGAPAAGWAQSWVTYESEAGRYRVDMPGAPRELPVKTFDNGGVLNGASFNDNSMEYYASYTDYPDGAFGKLTAADVLANARDGSANGHSLLRDKSMTIAGHPGREYVIARNNNRIVVIRTMLAGTRLYQVIYAAPGQTEPTSPDIRRFLDSFTLK